MNGWPDWAVLWPDRVWVIELKSEAGSHRADQLPYYLRLAAAAHPTRRVDLTYITGPLTKPAPALAEGQRYSHLQWTQVLPLVEDVWGTDGRQEVRAYVEAARTVIENLTTLRPSEQRQAITGVIAAASIPAEVPNPPMESPNISLPATSVAPDGRRGRIARVGSGDSRRWPATRNRRHQPSRSRAPPGQGANPNRHPARR